MSETSAATERRDTACRRRGQLRSHGVMARRAARRRARPPARHPPTGTRRGPHRAARQDPRRSRMGGRAARDARHRSSGVSAHLVERASPPAISRPGARNVGGKRCDDRGAGGRSTPRLRQAASTATRPTRGILEQAPVLTVDRRVPAHYAQLRAVSGRRQPANDLWIAATALAHELTLLTADTRQAALPGVQAMLAAT
jgi:hypothetical protein